MEEKGLLEDISVYQDMGPDDSLTSESPASEFGQLEGVIGKVRCKLKSLVHCGKYQLKVFYLVFNLANLVHVCSFGDQVQDLQRILYL